MGLFPAAFLWILMKVGVNFLIVAYCLMWLAIFILPFYSAENYSILKNTTSQLAAQKTPNAWVMNVSFILLGLGTVLAGWPYFEGFVWHKIVVLIFGTSLVFCAFFKHAPINPLLDFDLHEDDWHSVFASLTGLSFTVLALSTGFILKSAKQRNLAIGIGIFATVLSWLMFKFDALTGVWQRLIFISSFGWLIYLFNNNIPLKR